MNNIGVPLPSMGTLHQVSIYKKFIEAILANREKVEKVMEAFNPTISKPIAPKTIPKLKNPGTFLISCSLGGLNVDDALCDSGASVNVMSLEMMKRIGINEMKQNSSSIMYVDASSRPPLGLIEDYPLRVGECLVPTDFMVVEREQPDKIPLILGTPFLNTAGASIDFPNKRVTLLHVNPKVSHPLRPSSSKICETINCKGIEVQAPRVEYVGICSTMVDGNDEEALELDGESLESLFRTSMKKGVESSKSAKKGTQNKTKMKNGKSTVYGDGFVLDQPCTMILTPWKHEDGVIEYKVKYRGRSKFFTSVKGILTPELKEKGQAGIQEVMTNVLKIELKDPPWSAHTPLSPT